MSRPAVEVAFRHIYPTTWPSPRVTGSFALAAKASDWPILRDTTVLAVWVAVPGYDILFVAGPVDVPNDCAPVDVGGATGD
jgi:hypothetical protein